MTAPDRSSPLQRMLGAFWFGSGAFLLFAAAPAAFRASPTASIAADVVGAILTRWHYIALVAPLVLFMLAVRRQKTFIAILCFTAIVLAALEVAVDLRIRMIRTSVSIPISSLDRDDPIRRRFGLLHGVSSVLLLGQVVAAGWVAATRDREEVAAQPPAPAS